jgi:hypothetical protein
LEEAVVVVEDLIGGWGVVSSSGNGDVSFFASSGIGVDVSNGVFFAICKAWSSTVVCFCSVGLLLSEFLFLLELIDV